MRRKRLRELGISIGTLPTGRVNAITDVPGVLVGHTTLIRDKPSVVRTGVTAIVPCRNIWTDNLFAGVFSFNGNGEMTGAHWINEAGLLTSPIAITNTNEVGTVRDALVAYAAKTGTMGHFCLPVAAETCDSFLNGPPRFPIRHEHVFTALKSAKSGPVAEGCVGGGTGMICHDFKAGIGTSSRVVSARGKTYVVGALVQANYGERRFLRIDGVPVGRRLGHEEVPLPAFRLKPDKSIIVILATDAPLIPTQCERLARRATVGMAKCGGYGGNTSGDIFLSFSTGNVLPAQSKKPLNIKMLPHSELNPFFVAAADATEEAILNSLCAAETMVGYKDRVVHALPQDKLQEIMSESRGG
jgi:D-aminopeptidase